MSKRGRSGDPSSAPSKSSRPRRGLAGAKDALEVKRNDWGLSQQQVDTAAGVIFLDKATSLIQSDELRLFLYAKGILFEKISLVRIAEYNNLLDPHASGLANPFVEKLEKGRARLSRIVQAGEDSEDFQDGQQTMFETFIQAHGEWAPGNSFVVFRDHASLSGKAHALVERVQLSGLCYMHAPVVLQHYLVAMQRDDHVPMLDMGLYLRRFMNSDGLTRHIWDNRGGDSKDFLENILLPDPEPVFFSPAATADLRAAMNLYGPGLVQGFKVEAAFANSSNWQYLGARVGPSTGLHAMVLVGHRKEGNFDRYLLQNWWKNKPFVEVDAQYLESCGAIIHFVKTPQPDMGAFPVNLHDHVECELLDAPETFAPEMNDK
jgi:hypothetical protein